MVEEEEAAVEVEEVDEDDEEGDVSGIGAAGVVDAEDDEDVRTEDVTGDGNTEAELEGPVPNTTEMPVSVLWRMTLLRAAQVVEDEDEAAEVAETEAVVALVALA